MPRPPLKILIAEDVPEMRQTLRLLLEKLGHEVTEAASGKAALSAAISGVFDLIISDVVMEDGSGLWLVAELRQANIEIPVVLMSGNLEKDSALATSGVRAFLSKPFRKNDLIDTIHEVVGLL